MIVCVCVDSGAGEKLFISVGREPYHWRHPHISDRVRVYDSYSVRQDLQFRFLRVLSTALRTSLSQTPPFWTEAPTIWRDLQASSRFSRTRSKLKRRYGCSALGLPTIRHHCLESGRLFDVRLDAGDLESCCAAAGGGAGRVPETGRRPQR